MVVTRECLRKGSKYVNLVKPISFFKIIFDTSPIYYLLAMHFKPPKIFSFQTVFLFILEDDCNKNEIFPFRVYFDPLKLRFIKFFSPYLYTELRDLEVLKNRFRPKC